MSAWNWICLSPCILMLIGLALIVGYAILEDVYGSQGVKLVWRYELLQFVLPITVAAMVSLALNAIPRYGQGFEIVILTVILISCLAAAVNTISVRQRIQSTEQVLFRSSERTTAAYSSFAIVSVLGIVLAAMSLALAPVSTTIYRIAIVLFGLFLIIIGLNTYYRTRYPLIANSTGLIAGGAHYKWDRIRTYYIAPAQRSAPLVLRVRAWIPLTDTAIVPLVLDEVDEVSALLAERLPGLRYAEQSPSDVGDTVTKLA